MEPVQVACSKGKLELCCFMSPVTRACSTRRHSQRGPRDVSALPSLNNQNSQTTLMATLVVRVRVHEHCHLPPRKTPQPRCESSITAPHQRTSSSPRAWQAYQSSFSTVTSHSTGISRNNTTSPNAVRRATVALTSICWQPCPSQYRRSVPLTAPAAENICALMLSLFVLRCCPRQAPVAVSSRVSEMSRILRLDGD